MYRIVATDPAHSDALPVLTALSAVLAAITGSSGEASFALDDVRVDGAVFLLAYDEHGVACACGALRPLHDGVAEIKRMYAAPDSQGLGARVLTELEWQAKKLGYRAVWLETRQVNKRAVNFYLKQGYRVIDNYGRYIGRPEAVCFGKELTC